VNRENTKDRDQIQREYIQWYIESLTVEDLIELVYKQMDEDLDMLDDVELVKEVKHYAPDLVDNITLLVS
tara:strand:+ start:208 stop:417 length:210 start_codon:yes stop_codon:yes gene_type:complete